MNTQWGVYNLRGKLVDGTTVDARARNADRWFVRWRVNGDPHKRTFRQKGHAATFRDHLLRAQVMGWPADQRGWPLTPTDAPDHTHHADEAPANAITHGRVCPDFG